MQRTVKMLRPWRILLILVLPVCSFAHAGEANKTAGDILQMSGAQGGLIVDLACGNGELLAAFAGQGKFLAHGLTTEAATAASIHERLADKGLAGVAGAEALPLDRLPYANNMVNVLVGDDLPRLIKKGVKLSEIFRVLRPYGSACLGVPADARKDIEMQLTKAGIKDYRFEQKSRLWLVLNKPLPAGMDGWTHWNHGPDGNPVSQDQLIERPNQIQWITGQRWGDRRLGDIAGRGGAVGVRTAGGRNYYIMGAEGAFSKTGYQLVARDAFNGVMLWFQNIKDLNKRLVVAADKEVYLDRAGEIVALDGATGKLLRTYGKVDRCKDLLLADGVLVSFDSKGARAFDVATGKQKWSNSKATRAGSPVIKGGKAFFTSGGGITCLDMKNGELKWNKRVRGGILFAFDDKLLTRTSKKGVQTKYGLRYTAISAKDGAEVWSYSCDRPSGRYTEAYLAGGLIWIQGHHDRKARKTEGFHNKKGGLSYKFDGLNLKTGEVSRSFLAPVMLQYACYPHYATDRFHLGIRPVYFTEWKTAKVTRFEATRQACQSNCGLGYGMFYGLYTASTMCNCIRPAMSGVSAFTSDGKTINGEVPIDGQGRLVKGLAAAPESASAPDSGDWPMYRRDMRRAAAVAAEIPARQLAVAWRRPLLPAGSAAAGKANALRSDWTLNEVCSDSITQATVAEGKVFVSLTHTRQIVAMGQKDGKVAWKFRAPARVDAPPTIHKGLCLFGCNDGWVYCLRADNGKLVWRFRAAPAHRRVVAYGQVESAWPVLGGVLVVGDRACVIAGRTTETDGGLYVHALDVKTGKPLWSKRCVKPDDGAIGGWNLRGMGRDYVGPADVLVSNGAMVGIAGHRGGCFSLESGRKASSGSLPHFGWNRSQHAQVMKTQYPPMATARGQACRPTAYRDRKTKKRHYFISMLGRGGWKIELPVPKLLDAVAIAGGTVMAAVSDGPNAAAGELRLLSVKDGSVLATHTLPAAPAFDGVSVAGGKVYVALQDGSIMCFGAK